MSDLQCPCTAILIGQAPLARVRERAQAYHDRNIASVYSAAEDAAVAVAAADALGVQARALKDLAPGENTFAALESVSDVHRGETVLVVCDLASLGPSYEALEVAEVAIDADGWARRDGPE